jgi:hypothetical protein
MKRNVFLSLALAAAFSAAAQHDRIISNWSQSQMIYNPGAVATGQGDMSFFANHRSQWLTVPEMGVGIRSNFVNGEFKIKEEGLATILALVLVYLAISLGLLILLHSAFLCL